MARILAMSLGLVCLSLQVSGQERGVGLKPKPFMEWFLMNVSEDNKPSRDSFEIWQLTGDFSDSPPSCSLDAVRFSVGDSTNVQVFPHVARLVTEARPGIFRIEMDGRANVLEVVVEFNADRSQIVNINGSLRVGTRLQSVRVFQVDRTNENRMLPPLRNPSYLLGRR